MKEKMRGKPRFIVVLAAIGLIFGSFLVAAPASAVGSFSNGAIADRAETRSEGVWAGQCKRFVNDVVREASTGSSTGTINLSGYQAGFAAAGAVEVSAANAVRGDIIQVTPAGSNDSTAESLFNLSMPSRQLHTAIILSNNGSGNFGVIDSNSAGYPELVHRHNYNPYTSAAGSTIKIWRLGTVTSALPVAVHKSDLTWIEPASTAGLSKLTTNPSNGGGWSLGWRDGDWNTPTKVVSGDFNGDGKSDLTWIEPASTAGLSKLTTNVSNGAGWSLGWRDGDWNTPTFVVSGDYDGNGKDDLAWIEPFTTPGQSKMTILLSTGSGWTLGWRVEGWNTPSHVISGDFDGNGKDDLTWIEPAATAGLSNLTTVLSTGAGWTLGWRDGPWNTPTFVIAGNFGGDSKDDLTWIEPAATAGLSKLTTNFSNGGGWSLGWRDGEWNTPSHVISGDFNADGKTDITWIEPASTPGLSKLTTNFSYGTGWSLGWRDGDWNTPTFVISGDFNGS